MIIVHLVSIQDSERDYSHVIILTHVMMMTHVDTCYAHDVVIMAPTVTELNKC